MEACSCEGNGKAEGMEVSISLLICSTFRTSPRHTSRAICTLSLSNPQPLISKLATKRTQPNHAYAHASQPRFQHLDRRRSIQLCTFHSWLCCSQQLVRPSYSPNLYRSTSTISSAGGPKASQRYVPPLWAVYLRATSSLGRSRWSGGGGQWYAVPVPSRSLLEHRHSPNPPKSDSS